MQYSGLKLSNLKIKKFEKSSFNFFESALSSIIPLLCSVTGNANLLTTPVVKFENKKDSNEKVWVINKMAANQHTLEMLLCQIKNGKMFGAGCVLIKMSDEVCNAYVLNVKNGQSMGYLKSFSWSGVKNNILTKLTFNALNFTERSFFFESKFSALEMFPNGW